MASPSKPSTDNGFYPVYPQFLGPVPPAPPSTPVQKGIKGGSIPELSLSAIEVAVVERKSPTEAQKKRAKRIQDDEVAKLMQKLKMNTDKK